MGGGEGRSDKGSRYQGADRPTWAKGLDFTDLISLDRESATTG
jgi:hypothetical protein